jgi:hypothetical protein
VEFVLSIVEIRESDKVEVHRRLWKRINVGDFVD